MMLRIFVKITDQGVLVRGNDHSAGGHDVFGLYSVEAQQVADDLELILLEDAFLFPYFRHGRKFGAAEYASFLVFVQKAGDHLGHPYQGIKNYDDHLQGIDRKWRQGLPVIGAQRFWYDLGENEDGQGHQGADHSFGGDGQVEAKQAQGAAIAPDLLRLHTHAHGANRMGNGIEGQDAGQRPVNILLKDLEQFSHPGALFVFQFNKGRGNAQEYRFPDGTQEGEPYGEHEKENQEQDVGGHIRFMLL